MVLLENLFRIHDVVLLVGGSGLFVHAVCNGLDDLPRPSPGVRDRLNALYRDKGLPHLQELLRECDPVYYAMVDIHNPQRVIRALEIYESTGIPFSQFRKQEVMKRPFSILKIGLDMDRERLYQRINERVDAMMEAGLLEEVKALNAYRHKPALQTVGYAELFDYLDGKCTLQEAVANIKQHTRRYAKRQLTWFRKDDNTHWFSPGEVQEILRLVQAETEAV